jgi:NTP pyrophosphatase (non-canonical NTP hydrolase)
MDTLQQTVNWFREAVREPTDRNKAVQIGCHIEEFGEMLEAIGDQGLAKRMQGIAAEYKQGEVEYSKLVIDRKELLDSLADQIVTAVGIASMLDMDIVGALQEVNRSNYSKFVNGRAVFDENGKIKKGADYSKPDLTGLY